MNQLEVESLYLQYFAMGDSRTLADLAQNTGKSKDTLYKLSAKQKWVERIKIDTIVLKEKLGSYDIENLGVSERLVAISQESLHKVHKAIRNVPIKSVKDAQLMLTISQLTASRPTEITQAVIHDDNLVSASIILDIIEMLPKEWADFANAELEKRIAVHIDETDSNRAQYYN